MLRRTFALLLLAMVGLAARTEAGPITFSDRAAFEAAVGDFTLSDFNDPSQHPCAMNMDPSSYLCTGDYGGLTWRGDYANAGIWGGEFSFRIDASSTLTPTERIRAFGFDVVGGDFETMGDMGFSYRLGGGHEISLILAQHSFFGVLFDPRDELLSLNFFAPPGTRLGSWPAVTIDNLAVATTTVPEPTTLLLFGLGLTAAMMRRRRRG